MILQIHAKAFLQRICLKLFCLFRETLRSWVIFYGASIPLEIESNGSGLKGFMNVVVNVDE